MPISRILAAAFAATLTGALCPSALAVPTQEVQKILAGDAAAGDRFGYSVSVDGDTAVVGAVFDDDGAPNSGSAYVYVRDSGGTWSEQEKRTASDAAAGDLFGFSVSVDGDIAMVGALRNDDSGSESGSAYVYVRDSGGTWSEQEKLTASDAATGDQFGYSVAVDGDTAVVGAVFDDDGGNTSGSAYVYVRDSGGTWSEQAKLTAGDAAADDLFGYSVSVDGDTAVVGARSNDDGDAIDSGSAYVYVRDSGGTWSEQGKLTASDAATGC